MIRIVKYEPEWVQQAIKEGKKPFFVQMPIEYDHKQGISTITGLGTAVERSRTGHKMSQKFVDKLKQSASDTNPKPLFLNHDPNQIAGKVTGHRQGKTDEINPIAQLRTPNQNPIVDAPRANIESLIQDGIPLGMSFGGTADDVKIVKEKDGSFTYDVQDGELMEWSITPINAVKRSDGSVKDACPGGICQQIANQIRDGPYLPEITENIELSNLKKQDTDGTVECPQCGADVNEDDTYCPNCGADLTDGEPTQSVKNNLNQSIGGNNMAENNEIKEMRQMMAEMAGTIKQQGEIIINMKQAEDDRIAEQKRIEQETKAKEEKEALMNDMAESTANVIAQIIGPLLKSREGLGQASIQTPNPLEQSCSICS